MTRPDPHRRIDDIIAEALRREIVALLSHCTDNQNETFNRVFPAGIEVLKEGDLRRAVALCQRTVIKNWRKDGLE